MTAFQEVVLLIWIDINVLFVICRLYRANEKLKQKLGSNRANGLPSS